MPTADSNFFRIKLSPISETELQEVRALWDENGDPDYDAVLSDENPLADQGLEGLRRCRPLRAVLSSVRQRWGAVALLETPYLDLEFWHGHAGLYEWCFKPYPLPCMRLHFFASEKTIAQPEKYDGELARWLSESLLSGLAWPRLVVAAQAENKHEGLCYIGYCVLRPIPKYRLSRTAIKFDDRRDSQRPARVDCAPEEQCPGRPHLRIHKKCRAHLLNARLEIRTPEFIQQDPHLGACATASMWVALTSIDSPPVGTIVFPYTTITRQANSGAPGLTPSESLLEWDPAAGDGAQSLAEMRRAIERSGWHMGRNDVQAGASTAAEAERLRHGIHAYLDSRFPVLVCTSDRTQRAGHVVALVGFYEPDTLSVGHLPPAAIYVNNVDTNIPIEVSQQHRVISSGIRAFYAHDDAYGPFNRVVLPFADEQPPEADQDEPGTSTTNAAPADADRKRAPIVKLGRVEPRQVHEIRHIVVPLPLDVRTSVRVHPYAVLATGRGGSWPVCR